MAKKKAATHASKSKKALARAAKTSKTKPTPVVAKQPRSKQQAAVQAGMFLQTDDSWSARAFDPNDLHCVDRELFG